jgi:hypothetical protein
MPSVICSGIGILPKGKEQWRAVELTYHLNKTGAAALISRLGKDELGEVSYAYCCEKKIPAAFIGSDPDMTRGRFLQIPIKKKKSLSHR